MSNGLGSYAFLPWLRRGISTHITQHEGDPISGRAELQVTVGIAGGPESAPLNVTLSFLGPGDVRSFDARAISRHWPRPDVPEVPPNYFPLLELAPADLAWRYTPATANEQDRLRPWLALIVLHEDEIASIQPPTNTRPHALLRTQAGAPLPPHDQLWAWAHVHVDGGDELDAPTLRGLLDDGWHRVVARLLCPRRLDPRTTYTAFLVPTFEATRCAVLGVPADATMDAATPAWGNDGAAVDLPIFYRWSFQTGDAGDFASLAARIVPRDLPPTAGTRPLDESSPGMGLPAAASVPLAVESALAALDAASTPWADSERQTWTTALAALLNLPEQRLQQAGAPRTLAPPLYGRWYAASGTLEPAGTPAWFEELNADPRLRTASALGWSVVQRNQPQLLAGAWAQVQSVRDANARLRQAQLAREAATQLYLRSIVGRSQLSLMLLTRPLHGRVLLTASASQPAAVTVQAVVRSSPLRAGVLHPTYVRLARPLGPVGVRQGRALDPATTLVTRVNTGELTIAPTPATPGAMVTPARAAAAIAPVWLTSEVVKVVVTSPVLTHPVHPVDTSGVVTTTHSPERLATTPVIARPGPASPVGPPTPAGPVTTTPAAEAAAARVAALTDATWASWPRSVALPTKSELSQFLSQVQAAQGSSPAALQDELQRRMALRDATFSATQIQAAPARPGFVARELQADGTLPAAPVSAAAEDTRFRTAVSGVFGAFGDLNAAPAAGDTLTSVDLPATAAALSGAIDPRLTIGATFTQGLHVTGAWNPPDPLEPVMAAPAFPQPLYKPLFDLSPDWILTGFDALPQDSVTLARVNERFIEAFMTGANDELGRTLLFNEYPTDQRGTYFRQFWDVSGVGEPAPDINRIAEWPRTAALGANSSRPNPNALVLLVRAELLRRYPNLVVYAIEAQWNADGSRSVPATNPNERSPDFLGTLGSGAAFWGFSLTTAEARGASSQAAGAAGWYLALQEHPSEPRFGLEPPAATFATTPQSSAKLAWSDLAADAVTLGASSYINLGASLPNLTAVTDAGGAAWHVSDGARASDLARLTYREPARILIHASRMIPADVP
jgi:hypothetical protein